MKRTYWRSLWAHRLNLLRKSLTTRTAILLLACLTVGCTSEHGDEVDPKARTARPSWDVKVFVLPLDGHEYAVADGVHCVGICHHFGCPCLERSSGLTPEAEYTR